LALLWFIWLWAVKCVYAPISPLGMGEPMGSSMNVGRSDDFAGGTVVHINSGGAGSYWPRW